MKVYTDDELIIFGISKNLVNDEALEELVDTEFDFINFKNAALSVKEEEIPKNIYELLNESGITSTIF